MKTTQVYDWPTRFFHWSFAALFIGAFFIAKTYDDDSAIYPYHMMLGMTLLLVVTLRLVWGVIGSRYARFSSFHLAPQQLLSYFKNIFSSQASRELGHNPASSWAALAMIFFSIGLAVTGYLMVQKINKHFFEDIHELLAYGFVLTVVAHIAGLILHSWKHHDNIAFSMLHGRKQSIEGEVGIPKNHALSGFIFLACLALFVIYLNQSYDTSTRSLKIFGQTLQLGEAEESTND